MDKDMRLFRKKLNQNEKLLKNIEKYEQKEKAKQQESKVLGQKLVKGTTNKEKNTNVYNSQQGKSIRSMV
jgi:hypothetical protein